MSAPDSPRHRYRPEVDGLRALAVVPVILFHAGFSWFEGGYVGVDIFFVVSGYLITSIIAEEHGSGTFSVVNFYERRARRILPALFLVMGVSAVVAWLLMLPEQLRSFGLSFSAVTVFASNVLFWLTSGYFDLAAEEKPLLHTWSLGVEEQYYIVFPLLLTVLWRWGNRTLLVVLTLLTLLSFVVCQWWSLTRPTANFFLAPPRAWELLLGSVLALLSLRQPLYEHCSRAICEVLSALGLLLVCVAIFTFDSKTPFPSAFALLPTVGTLLILAFAGPGTAIHRSLSLPWVVGIGLISYSAYLWHQPLFAFWRIVSPVAPPMWTFGALGMLALALAWLSWRWVERPIRDRARWSRTQIFSCAAIVSAACFILGVLMYVHDGFPDRWSVAEQQFLSPAKTAIRECPRHDDYLNVCVLGASGIEPTILMIGDSHADAIATAFSSALERRGQSAYLVHTRCHPIAGFFNSMDGTKPERIADCRNVWQHLLAFARTPEVRDIVLLFRWTMQLYPVEGRIESVWFDNGEGGIENDVPERQNFALDSNGKLTNAAAVKAANLREFIMHMTASKPTVLVYPIPEVGWHVPKLNLTQIIRGQAPGIITTAASRYRQRNAFAIEVLDSVDSPQLERVRPARLFCDSLVKDRCVAQWNQQPLYFDNDHLSLAGAEWLVAEIMRSLPQDPRGGSE